MADREMTAKERSHVSLSGPDCAPLILEYLTDARLSPDQEEASDGIEIGPGMDWSKTGFAVDHGDDDASK